MPHIMINAPEIFYSSFILAGISHKRPPQAPLDIGLDILCLLSTGCFL